MGRIEAFALGNKPLPSLVDGLANGAGYGLILIAIAFIRELFGSGTLFGAQVIPASWYVAEGGWYLNNGLFIMPPMALIITGCFIWLQRSFQKEENKK
jgi:Na+-transporting NADH:ubiquinone oxidoreductase subunit D